MCLKSFVLTAVATVAIAAAAVAQNPESGEGGIELRAVLHDPAKPLAEFYLADAENGRTKLELMAEGLSQPMSATPIGGSLMLYSSPTASGDAKADLAAQAKLPAGAKRVIAVIVAAAPEAPTPYRMMLFDDSPRAFPWGESRVVNLTAVDFALEVGEHRIGLAAGKVTPVPKITQVNEFSHAQTNFYYRRGERWETFTERQLQYVADLRRIFLIHSARGALQPNLRTIVDHAPPELPDGVSG